MDKVLIIGLIIHIIGSIVAIVIHCKDGTFEWAVKNGDGIYRATPADVVFQDLFLWEVFLLVFVMVSIDDFINELFKRKYQNTNKTHVLNEKGE